MKDPDDITDRAGELISDGLCMLQEAVASNSLSKKYAADELDMWIRVFNREIAYLTGKRGPTRG